MMETVTETSDLNELIQKYDNDRTRFNRMAYARCKKLFVHSFLLFSCDYGLRLSCVISVLQAFQ